MQQTNYQHITDAELLDKFYQDGNNQWLGILLQRYTMLLLGTCMKYLKNEEAAKDAVQQVFLKAITELQKYPVQYFKSWLYMIAKNHCLIQLRNKNRIEPIETTEYLLVDDLNLTEQFDKESTLQLLELSLPQLSTEQKTCITLFYLQQKSYQQIAETTGYTLLQVKSFIQNGKRNLKIMVEKQQPA